MYVYMYIHIYIYIYINYIYYVIYISLVPKIVALNIYMRDMDTASLRINAPSHKRFHLGK